MEHRKTHGNEPKAFPRYDDAAHIDTAAVAPKGGHPGEHALRGDPAATEYTDRYCRPDGR